MVIEEAFLTAYAIILFAQWGEADEYQFMVRVRHALLIKLLHFIHHLNINLIIINKKSDVRKR